MLPVRCGCGIRHRVPWRLGGKILRCKCGRETRIPDPGTWLAVGVVGWAVLTTLAIHLLSDRWLPATALAFGPRWVLLVPCLLAAPVIIWLRPRLAVAPLGAVGLVAWAAMGWSWGVARHVVPAGGAGLRVMTYNVEGGLEVSRHLDALLERWSPDAAVFEECDDSLYAALGAVRGMTRDRRFGLCLLSRLPVVRSDTMDRSGFEATLAAGLGGSGAVWRIVLQSGAGPVALVGMHLETPRKGFEPVLAGDWSTLEGNTIVRRIESARARRFVDADTLPVIIVGDFNQPVESAIFRASWGDFRDAWSDAGLGYGYTKRDVPKIRARIDHVLTDGRWRAVTAAVGDEPWSDHWPLIVDLRAVR